MTTPHQSLDAEADAILNSLNAAPAAQPQGQFAQAAPVATQQQHIADSMPFADAAVLSGHQPSQPITQQPSVAPMQQPALQPAAQPDPMIFQQMQSMSMQMQKMEQLIEGLNAAKQQGKEVDDQTGQASTLLDDLKSKLDEIPDEYEDTAQMKAVFLQGFETLANQMQTMQPTQVQTTTPANDGGVDGHGGQLIAHHPDLFTVVNQPAFLAWAQADPVRNQTRMYGETLQSIQLLTDYKAYLSGQAQQHAQASALQQAQPSHAAAIEPTNPGGNMPAQVSADNLHQILDQTNDKYGTEFAKSEDSIDALLNSLM